MRTIKVMYEFEGEKKTLTAVLTDDLFNYVETPENEATCIASGAGGSFGIWAIYFDDNNIEVDLFCEVDDNGKEIKTFIPKGMWIYNAEPRQHLTDFYVLEV